MQLGYFSIHADFIIGNNKNTSLTLASKCPDSCSKGVKPNPIYFQHIQLKCGIKSALYNRLRFPKVVGFQHVQHIISSYKVPTASLHLCVWILAKIALLFLPDSWYQMADGAGIPTGMAFYCQPHLQIQSAQSGLLIQGPSQYQLREDNIHEGPRWLYLWVSVVLVELQRRRQSPGMAWECETSWAKKKGVQNR